MPSNAAGRSIGSMMCLFDFQPFTRSPFSFTKSNEDTMKQIFEGVGALKK